MSAPKVERIDELPAASWSLPGTTMYVRLGCLGCTEGVCFSVSTQSGDLSPLGFEGHELQEIVSLAPAYSVVHQGTTGMWDQCEAQIVCQDASDIQLVRQLINEEYDANL